MCVCVLPVCALCICDALCYTRPHACRAALPPIILMWAERLKRSDQFDLRVPPYVLFISAPGGALPWTRPDVGHRAECESSRETYESCTPGGAGGLWGPGGARPLVRCALTIIRFPAPAAARCEPCVHSNVFLTAPRFMWFSLASAGPTVIPLSSRFAAVLIS